MLIFFALYVVVVLWGVKLRTKSANEYLDMEHTQSVKDSYDPAAILWLGSGKYLFVFCRVCADNPCLDLSV